MKRLNTLILIIALLAFGSGVVYAQLGGPGWNAFEGSLRVLDDLEVLDDATITDALTTADLTASDDLVVTDDTTMSDALTVAGITTLNGNLLLDDDLNFDEETRIVVTDGSTITPLGTNTPISSTAATGTSSITAGAEGDLLILWNIGSQTITLTDTGTLKLSGNAALGATDSIMLLADGTNWVQIAPESDN